MIGGVDLTSLEDFISGAFGGIIVLVYFVSMLLADKLHTDAEFKREAKALERERDAHAETKRALEAAIARADTAVRASELVAQALTAADQRGGQGRRHVPQED